jgi:superfamily I DNA and/or RNA helicase
VRELLAAGLPPQQAAIICPYAAQSRWLQSPARWQSGCSQQGGRPPDGLEIDTVDGFQGREKEAIIITLVRSNPRGEIGFLADVRRMNVALTRARRKLILIGDSATIAGNPFYHRLLDYLEQRGAYHSVWEYQD